MLANLNSQLAVAKDAVDQTQRSFFVVFSDALAAKGAALERMSQVRKEVEQKSQESIEAAQRLDRQFKEVQDQMAGLVETIRKTSPEVARASTSYGDAVANLRSEIETVRKEIKYPQIQTKGINPEDVDVNVVDGKFFGREFSYDIYFDEPVEYCFPSQLFYNNVWRSWWSTKEDGSGKHWRIRFQPTNEKAVLGRAYGQVIGVSLSTSKR